MFMQPSFRWYGPEDPVSLNAIRQTGAEAVVSSLHTRAYGEVWPLEEIAEYQRHIARHGLNWNVVESLPVHEELKTGRGNTKQLLSNYQQSIANLGKCGVRIITYNFMPVLDWVRTDLNYLLPDGTRTLLYNRVEFAAFELFCLNRPGAEAEYGEQEFQMAKRYFDRLSLAGRKELAENIIDHLPGFRGTTLEQVRDRLAQYSNIRREDLLENLRRFLEKAVPAAAEANCILVLHPDDPPRSILGLPRICCNGKDLEIILKLVDHPANALCFCAGSLSANPENNVAQLFKRFASRVGFLHLRNTTCDGKGNFYESGHLSGSVDMFELVSSILEEQLRRRGEGREDFRIPFRPDHGCVMLDDLDKPPCPNPGYSAIGRMKGLAELRGLEYGIVNARFPQAIPFLQQKQPDKEIR